MNRNTGRKLAVVIASVILASFWAACGERGDSSSFVKTYTVTFMQTGQPDVVRVVEAGKAVTDIPEIKPVTGYTVAWEDIDLTNVTADKIVNAVKTPKQYTVTYDANEGTMSAKTEIFTYDAEYTLQLPVRNDYSFVCWKNGIASIALTGIWRIAEDVTLTAAWKAIEAETYTITFIQEGQSDVVKTLKKGETLTDVPVPVSAAGYDIVWDKTDFSDVSENVTVTAIKTPKTYTITYELGSLKDDKYVKIEASAQKVVFGAEYNLIKPSCYGYHFKHWIRKGTEEIEENGTYSVASDLTLVAVWEKNETSDRWKPTPDSDDGWTDFY